MEDVEETQQNMVSNLPLLFANGYPTSLEKITEKQLENFIPFMVQCSLGHINLQGKVGCSEPEWWPEDVPFSIPLVKSKKFEGNWLEKMKKTVLTCYEFHKSIFLLKFCKGLAAYEPARLRFINNYNSTTSLYDRRSNKLLVTFRNENMSYDQTQRNRKCLLIQKSRSQATEQQQQMVEPALFDIYLCDNCDAELYSYEAITEHEKTCTADDDVIICDSPSPSPPPFTIDIIDNENDNDELRQTFLLNFNLQNCEATGSPTKKTKANRNSASLLKKEENDLLNATAPVEKLKRLPRRNRGIYALSRCPTIPLSSPAGQLMIKNTKTVMSEEYLFERLDRMERFCHAPSLLHGVPRPKFLEKKVNFIHVPCTFKKLADFRYHTYIYPRRQFSNAHRMEAFMFLNSLLIKRCRPVSVRLKKLTSNDIQRIQSNANSQASRNHNNNNNYMTTKLANINSYQSHTLNQSHNNTIVIDTIDLCSSDEEEEITEIGKWSGAAISTPATIAENMMNNNHHNLNPEITLTPIPRDFDKSLEEYRKRNTFEGNFLVSQSIGGGAGVNQPKPLQPSVFLFSNYTTENVHPFHHHHHRFVPNSNNNSPQIADINFQNQENLENRIKTTAQDWPLSQNNNRSVVDRSNNNQKVYQLMSFVSGGDVDINKITSPNRTLSIDLTS